MLGTVARTLDTILNAFDKVMVAIASLSLLAIMVLIFLDAMLRYLFNNPLTLTFDLVTLYLMSAALLTILSHTLRHGGHISIDLFANMMPRRVYLVLVGIALLAGTLVCAVIAWQTSKLAFESWEMNEVMTGIYTWPLWLGKAIVAVSFIGLAARLFQIGTFNLLAGLRNDESLAIALMHDPADPEGEI